MNAVQGQVKMLNALSAERERLITFDWRPIFTEDVTFEMGLKG